jgi:hypothetical protein
MKITNTIQTDLTWFYVEGTETELGQCCRWVDQNKTMFVIYNKAEYPEIIPGDGTFSSKIKAIKNGTALMVQKFGFKSKNDAMRFKLVML